MLSLPLVLGASFCFACCSVVQAQQGPAPHARDIFVRQDTTASGPFTISQTSSTPSPSGTAGTGPIIAFHFVQAMNTCGSGIITWDYSGPSDQKLSLNVTNINVPQSPPSQSSSPLPSSSPAPSPVHFGFHRRQNADGSSLNIVIDSNLDPASGRYNWSKVNVPPGSYVIKSTIGEDSTISPPFLVSTSSDASCLTAQPPSSSSFSPSSTIVAQASSSGLPFSGSTSKHHTGAIVGGVLGAVAVIAVVVAALVFIRLCRRRRNPRTGKWGGLKSVDSSMANRSFAKQSNISPRAGRSVLTEVGPTTISSGSGIASVDRNAASVPSIDTEGQAGVSQEKVLTPVYDRATFVAPSISPSYSNPFEDNSAPMPKSRRRSSTNSTLYDFSQQSHGEENDIIVQPPMRRSSITGTTTTSSTQRRQHPEYPPTSVQMDRISSASSGKGGANRTTGKTPRKPVPKYDTAAEENSEPLSSSFGDSILTTGSESPIVSRKNSATPGYVDTGPGNHTLLHQDSFGNLKMDKPVHYVLPDLPPPAMN